MLVITCLNDEILIYNKLTLLLAQRKEEDDGKKMEILIDAPSYIVSRVIHGLGWNNEKGEDKKSGDKRPVRSIECTEMDNMETFNYFMTVTRQLQSSLSLPILERSEACATLTTWWIQDLTNFQNWMNDMTIEIVSNFTKDGNNKSKT